MELHKHPRIDALIVCIHPIHPRLGVDVIGVMILRINRDTPDGQGTLARTMDIVGIVLLEEGSGIVLISKDTAKLHQQLCAIECQHLRLCRACIIVVRLLPVSSEDGDRAEGGEAQRAQLRLTLTQGRQRRAVLLQGKRITCELLHGIVLGLGGGEVDDGQKSRQHPGNNQDTTDRPEEVMPLVALAREGGIELLGLLLPTCTVVGDAEVEARHRHKRPNGTEDDDDPAPQLHLTAYIGEVDPVRDGTEPRPQTFAARTLLQHLPRLARDVDFVPFSPREMQAVEGEVFTQLGKGRPLVKIRERVDALDRLTPALSDVLKVAAVKMQRTQGVPCEGEHLLIPLTRLERQASTTIGIGTTREGEPFQMERIQGGRSQ